MGSVIDYIECPHCGEPNCVSDYYYKSGEEYVQCPDCGYYRSVEIKEDSRKKNFSDMTDEDWSVTELKKPYGAYRVKSKDSVAVMGGSISTKRHYDRIVENLTEDIEEFTVSRWVNGKVVVVDVLRKMKLEKLRSVIGKELNR